MSFFDRPVRVEPGRTSRWDIDLKHDGLGAIDGEVPAGLQGAARTECALLAGGRPRRGPVLGREADLRGGRFQLEMPRPGTYRVWLSEKSGARIAEAEVVVKRGLRTNLVVPEPTGSMVVPLEGPLPITGARPIHETGTFELVLWEDDRARDQSLSTGIATGRVAMAESLRFDGILSGRVQARIRIPGFQTLESDPVWVEEGRESLAPVLRLVPAGGAGR